MRAWLSNIAKVFPPHEIRADGHAQVTVVSRFGTLKLGRQVFFNEQTATHIMPGNQVLPPHEGIIITRGLQEWACLLPQELPFESVARLLGWQAQEEEILSSTTVRSLVRTHGQIIRQAEEAEVEELLNHPDLSEVSPKLVDHEQPRRRPGWPEELNGAVQAALEAGQTRPPQGVSFADWERVLETRRQDETLPTTQLRKLGPKLERNQVLATTDEVLTRKPKKRSFWELRTARVVSEAGYRYLSGTGESFLKQLLVLLLLLGVASQDRTLLLIADGARWIRNFYTSMLDGIVNKTMILDWYHLRKKIYQFSSMICGGRKAKAQFVCSLYGHLWRGEVQAATDYLETYRPEARNEAKLEELISYLQERQEFIPNYRKRRKERGYIGSAHAEKANDLIVARRQKSRGMHWSLETSDALAALRTLMLNGGWELYWRHQQVLPLVAA